MPGGPSRFHAFRGRWCAAANSVRLPPRHSQPGWISRACSSSVKGFLAFPYEEPDADGLFVKVEGYGSKGLPAIPPGQVPLCGSWVLLQVHASQWDAHRAATGRPNPRLGESEPGALRLQARLGPLPASGARPTRSSRRRRATSASRRVMASSTMTAAGPAGPGWTSMPRRSGERPGPGLRPRLPVQPTIIPVPYL